jgi:hypothetical protein
MSVSEHSFSADEAAVDRQDTTDLQPREGRCGHARSGRTSSSIIQWLTSFDVTWPDSFCRGSAKSSKEAPGDRTFAFEDGGRAGWETDERMRVY